MQTALNLLLGHIFQATPKTQVFVADVIGTNHIINPWSQCILDFNKLIPGTIENMKTKGMQVYFVPMYNQTGICGASEGTEDYALCGGHKIHPTPAGYPRMASAFAKVILDHLTI